MKRKFLIGGGILGVLMQVVGYVDKTPAEAEAATLDQYPILRVFGVLLSIGCLIALGVQRRRLDKRAARTVTKIPKAASSPVRRHPRPPGRT